MRTFNDMINFGIVTEMRPTDYLNDTASKYHRWNRIVGKHIAGIFANRCAIYPYDINYLRNHEVPATVNLTTKPVDSSTKLPKWFDVSGQKLIKVDPKDIVSVFNDCVYYPGVQEAAHNFAL